MPSQPIELHRIRAMPSRSPDDDDILQPLLSAAPGRPYVIAQLGQSLDGRIATPTGASRWINGGSALDHLHRLRANVDAVVVGIGTVVADDPFLTVRRVAGRQPARVVIDPHGKLRADARCLAADGARCFVVRADDAPVPTGAEAVIVPDACDGVGGAISPHAIMQALYGRGLRKILIEGGATTVSRFIDADAVDRLHILLAPIILGSGVTGLSLAPIGELREARRPPTRVHILDDGDVLFDCDFSRQPEG